MIIGKPMAMTEVNRLAALKEYWTEELLDELVLAGVQGMPANDTILELFEMLEVKK